MFFGDGSPSIRPGNRTELIEQVISGTDRAVVAEERDYVEAIRAEAEPVRKLRVVRAAPWARRTDRSFAVALANRRASIR